MRDKRTPSALLSSSDRQDMSPAKRTLHAWLASAAAKVRRMKRAEGGDAA